MTVVDDRRETPQLDDAEYKAALARLREYRDMMESASRDADRASLARAADLAWVYADRRWMNDPDLPPARPNAVTGVLTPDSRYRFSKWVEQVSPVALRSRHTTELLTANDLKAQVSAVSAVAPTGEWALRPLKQLATKGYRDAIPEVYRRAVEIAEGDSPTAEQVRRAKRDYLAQFTRRQVRGKQQDTRSQREQEQVRLHFSRLLDQGVYGDAEKLLVALQRDLNARIPA